MYIIMNLQRSFMKNLKKKFRVYFDENLRTLDKVGKYTLQHDLLTPVLIINRFVLLVNGYDFRDNEKPIRNDTYSAVSITVRKFALTF